MAANIHRLIELLRVEVPGNRSRFDDMGGQGRFAARHIDGSVQTHYHRPA